MALTDEEKREFAERFRAEMAEKYPKVTPEPPPTPPPDPDAEREAEIERLRLELLDEFHRANNFIRHVDSKGQERWFSPEEYEERRKHRRKKKADNNTPNRPMSLWRVAVLTFGLALAVIVGWMMRP